MKVSRMKNFKGSWKLSMNEFVIPGELPDMNQIIKASKSHYMAYSTMKKKYTELVKTNAAHLPNIDKSDFVITWYCKNKRIDPDNLAVGAKMIFDGLVEIGVMENDGWGNVNSITNLFEVDKANPRIEVEIFELVKK